MAQYDIVLKRVYALLQPHAKDHALTESSALVEELGLASLQVMEMIAQLEDDFDISIPMNVLPNIVTVGDLAKEIAALHNC